MDMSFKNTQDYLDKQEQIVKKLKLIAPIDEKIKEADAKLHSFGFNALSLIGLGPDDFRSDTFNIDKVLPDLANTNLSKKDLERKIALLEAKKLEILEEINGLEAALRQLEQNARLDLERQRKEALLAKKQTFITAFERDPLGYIAGILSAAPTDLKLNDPKLYASADQIIAISGKFNDKIQKSHLWQAWKIVAAARDLAIQQKSPKDAEVYVAGAKQTFDVILKVLPEQFKDLEVLYRAKMFEKVDNYLEQVLFKDLIADQDKMLNMQREIDEQKNIFSKQELDDMAGLRKVKRTLFARH